MLAVRYHEASAYASKVQSCILSKCQWQPNIGTVHSALESLRKRDYLAGEVRLGRASNKSIKPMRFYRITDKGALCLDRAKQITDCMWLESINEKQQSKKQEQ